MTHPKLSNFSLPSYPVGSLRFSSSLSFLVALILVGLTGCPSSPPTKQTVSTNPPKTRHLHSPSPFRKQYAFPAHSELSPSRGPRHAPLQVVELLNPLSPSSKDIHQLRSTVWQKFPGLLRWTVRFNPTLQKDRGYFYARAMYASYRSGIFWNYLQRFFSNTTNRSYTELLQLAKDSGLDPQIFELKLLYEPYKMLIDRDMRWSHSLQITGKSLLFVNGALLEPPYTPSRVEQSLRWAYQRSQSFIQQGIPPQHLYQLWIKAGSVPSVTTAIPDAIQKRRYIHVPFAQLEGIPVRGPGDAPVSIVEYSDFTCVPCRAAYFSLHQLLQRYPQHLRFYFKYFPIQVHAESQRSAELAAAAQDQQKFWPLYELLFQQQQRIFSGDLIELARQVGMDTQWISGELDRKSYRRRVLINQYHGRQLGIRGVPAIIIDGRVVFGSRHLTHLVQVAEQELWKAGIPFRGR